MDGSVIIDLVVVAASILCCTFFAAAETGLTACSRERIFSLAKQNNRAALKILALREQKEALIGTVLLGNTLANTTAAAVATAAAMQVFGEGGVAIVTLVVAMLILVFGEVFPKTFALHNPERVALGIALPMGWLVAFLYPVTAAVKFVNDCILKLFGLSAVNSADLVSGMDVIRGTIELQHSEGSVEQLDRHMLGGILDLGDVYVGDVLVHRKQVEMVDADAPVEDMLQKILHSSHSRLPFWKDNPDNIIGLLHVRDIMALTIDTGVKRITSAMILERLSTPWFVPETTSLREQLFAFREQRKHFAHVVDEYGAFLGVVTLEDILEEIVGEIEDEYDRTRSNGIESHDDGGYLIDGATAIRDVNRHLDWELPEDEASTIAGLVIHESRCIPELGAEFVFFGYRFRIKKKKANQILRLYVCKL